MKIRKSNKGFTLTELLIVIAMIGILATVVYAGLGNAKAKSRDAKRVAELKVLEQAVEAYFQENYKFPDRKSDLSEYYEPVEWNKIEAKFEYRTNPERTTYCIGVILEYVDTSGNCPPSVVGSVLGPEYMIIPGPIIP